MADSRLDAPLPWDHVDTGIAKWWLKADLQRWVTKPCYKTPSQNPVTKHCSKTLAGAVLRGLSNWWLNPKLQRRVGKKNTC